MRDIDAYLKRIDFREAVAPDIATLRALHRSHVQAIPFENLSTVIGEPVAIDLDAVVAKLIDRGRGGYCFEHNTLFQAVLRHIGFDVRPLAARVVWNPQYVNPRTHMVLLLKLDNARWLADVGFGGATLTAPLSLEPGLEQPTSHETFRIVSRRPEYELQVMWAGSWRPMYRFDLQPQLPVDFEALNHYVATHPRSHFLTTLMAGRVMPDRRLALLNSKLTELEGGEPLAEATLDSVRKLTEALSGRFGIATDTIPALEYRLAGFLEKIAGTPD